MKNFTNKTKHIAKATMSTIIGLTLSSSVSGMMPHQIDSSAIYSKSTAAQFEQQNQSSTNPFQPNFEQESPSSTGSFSFFGMNAYRPQPEQGFVPPRINFSENRSTTPGYGSDSESESESFNISEQDTIDFNSIPVPERDSTYDQDRDRYYNIGSVGIQNSSRDMSAGKGEYVTKANSVVNASKIVRRTDGDKKFSIIATQAPTANTIDSFWDMIFFSKHVNDIVVLGSVLNYWNSKDTIASSKYTISGNYMSGLISSSAQKATINLTNNETKETKVVNIYNYFAWPDQDVPENFNDFINFVNIFKDSRKLVVHCSAGVGRTGTFAACLELLRNPKNTSAKQVITDMRTHRTSIVGNIRQYLFVKDFHDHVLLGS